MAQPKNETIGKCLCRGCREHVADVRRFKNHDRGARYLVCPECGMYRVQGAKPQAVLDAWIDANMVEDEPENLETNSNQDTKPVSENVEPDSKPGRAAKPVDTPDGSKPGPGFFSQADKQLTEMMEA